MRNCVYQVMSAVYSNRDERVRGKYPPHLEVHSYDHGAEANQLVSVIYLEKVAIQLNPRDVFEVH